MTRNSPVRVRARHLRVRALYIAGKAILRICAAAGSVLKAWLLGYEPVLYNGYPVGHIERRCAATGWPSRTAAR
jgi:hypothetical protein